MNPKYNEQLRRAQQLIKNGQPQEAAPLLKELLNQKQNDFRVWLLLTAIAPPAKKAGCLARADKLAPGHPAVVKAQESLLKAENLATTAPGQPVKISASAPDVQAEIAVTQLRQRLIKKHEEPVNVLEPTDKKWFRTTWAWAALILLFLGSSGYLIRSGFFGQTEVALLTAAIPDIKAQDSNIAAVVNNENEQSTIIHENIALVANLDSNTISNLSSTAVPLPTATATTSPLQPKNITASNIDRAAWTPTPLPTNTPTPTPTAVPTAVIDEYINISWPAVGPSELWVDVDLTNQWLVAYEGTTPIFETAISSGLAPNYTVTGQFRIYYRLESQTMDGTRLGFDYVTPNVPHVQYFYGDFALHGAYWHNNFGQPMSHGCVNLSLPDAAWLYDWADYGTLVNVHY
jgi:lipoprotein-anchoring transpeptidase ErfK/SrfK